MDNNNGKKNEIKIELTPEVASKRSLCQSRNDSTFT